MKASNLFSSPIDELYQGLILSIQQMPKWLKIAIGVVGLIALSYGFYQEPEIFSLLLIALSFGSFGLIVAWNRPEFGIILLIFLTSSFLFPDIIDIRLPIGGGLDLRDLVFFGLLGILTFRGLLQKSLTIPWWQVGVPLFLFVLLTIFSAGYSMFFRGTEANWIFRDLRLNLFYLLFFLTAWSLRKPKQREILVWGLFILSDITGLIIIMQQFLGTDNRLLAAMAIGDWHVWGQGSEGAGFGAVRVIPPGHVLMHFMLIASGVLSILSNRSTRMRLLYGAQFLFLGASLILTYTRAQWIASALAILIVLLVMIPYYKNLISQKITNWFLGFLTIFALLLLLVLPRIQSVSSVLRVTDRLSSIFTPSDTLESYSLQWRLFEQEEAIRSIRENPLLGVGIGNSYRNITLLQGEAQGHWTDGNLQAGSISRFTRYVHNSYFYITVRQGIPTILVFLWFCLSFLIMSGKQYSRLPLGEEKGLCLAFLAAFVGLMVWAFFHSHFVETKDSAVIGVVVGIIASIVAMQDREATSEIS